MGHWQGSHERQGSHPRVKGGTEPGGTEKLVALALAAQEPVALARGPSVSRGLLCSETSRRATGSRLAAGKCRAVSNWAASGVRQRADSAAAPPKAPQPLLPLVVAGSSPACLFRKDAFIASLSRI